MPPEIKPKVEIAAKDALTENRLDDAEKWSLAASRDHAGFSALATNFTVQLMNLQNALGRVSRTDR